MINYSRELSAQLDEIEALVEEAAGRIKRYKNVEKGKIIVSDSHGCPQYYFRKENENKRSYIPKFERERIKTLVQREYDEKVLSELTCFRNKMRSFMGCYKKFDVEEM